MANMEDVANLVRIHIKVGGTGPGRRHKIEVLNRSAIVLLVACWEAFVEDLASQAFSALLKEAADPLVFPRRVLAIASRFLREDQDQAKIWALAGHGWREVLAGHREYILTQYIGRLNTPRPENVDGLFDKLIGLKNLSGRWKWQGMPNAQALTNLEDLVTLRGQISHRVTAGEPVHRKDVEDAADLIVRMAVIASNRVATYIRSRTGKRAWADVVFRGVS